jgi:hypothetical protein
MNARRRIAFPAEFFMKDSFCFNCKIKVSAGSFSTGLKNIIDAHGFRAV